MPGAFNTDLLLLGLEGASSEYLCISILELEAASDIRHYVVEEEEESPSW